jgi:hypothetical protein
MRKFTLFLMSLFLSVGAMAQFTAGTEYRIKEKSTGLYLNVGGAGAHAYGEVYGSEKKDGDAANVQIFTFVDAGNGQYYVKSNSGEYITYTGGGQGWNVNGDSNESNAHSLTFESTGTTNEYKIKCYNQSKGANKYFKWEYVGASGKYHPFNDADAGAIFVVEQENLPVYTVTYKYSYNGVVVKTVTNEVVQGNAYPAYDLNLYAASYENVPTGTVTDNAEVTITVTFGELPFEFYATVEDIDNNGWYNLVMHSNHNTGNGTARYRTYVGAGNETTLAWGEHKTLTNAGDEYYWAFVGDPVNGFRVVNKSAEGKILSSDGTDSHNPVLLQEEGLAEGFNTTWSIAARKYDVNTDGDFVKKGDWFCLKHPAGRYMNANAGNGNVAFWTDNDNGSAVLAVKPLEIKEVADVATYFAETAISIPAGVEVYYASGINEAGYMGLEQITGIVYPETGIVVRYATEENVTFAPEIVSPGTATAPEGNLLKGTTKRTLINKDANKAYYVLGMTSGVGFYNAVNGENENEFYNGAFKAYLEMPATQGTAAFYGFDWAGTTGIDEVKTENGEVKTIYDLTGRRIEAITAPGIYIVGGKKVLVK